MKIFLINRFSVKVFHCCLVAVMIIAGHKGADAQVSLGLGSDLMSRYIWRGMNLGDYSPCIQPSLWVSHISKNRKHQLSAEVWGSYPLSGNSGDEIDLTIGYTFREMLSLKINDYYITGADPAEEYAYFVYHPDKTLHVFETVIGFDGTEKIPFTCLFGMNFYGDDARKMLNDSTEGSILMSKYLEVGFNFSLHEMEGHLFVGAALDKPDKRYNQVGYYENERPGIISLGFSLEREITLSEHLTLPLQVSFITNPMHRKAWLVLGIGFFTENGG